MNLPKICRFLRNTALLFVALVGSALAQTTIPLIVEYVPAPVAGQPFQIRITTSPCDSTQESAPVSVPRFVQTGNVLRLTTVGNQNFSPFCLEPVRTAVFNAPPLPAGNYTLEIHYQHPTIEPPLLRLRQSVPLSVSLGNVGSPVPAGGMAGAVILVLSLGAIAFWRLRAR